MKLKPPRPAKIARVEIIPLIDVVFFLLATFVLVSLSMTRLQGIKLDLPASRASSTDIEEPETINVAVLSGNQFAWDKQLVTWDQLLAKIARYSRESPDPRILIEGQEEADFGNAVAILDEARLQGISQVSIQTKLRPVELN